MKSNHFITNTTFCWEQFCWSFLRNALEPATAFCVDVSIFRKIRLWIIYHFGFLWLILHCGVFILAISKTIKNAWIDIFLFIITLSSPTAKTWTKNDIKKFDEEKKAKTHRVFWSAKPFSIVQLFFRQMTFATTAVINYNSLIYFMYFFSALFSWKHDIPLFHIFCVCSVFMSKFQDENCGVTWFLSALAW